MPSIVEGQAPVDVDLQTFSSLRVISVQYSLTWLWMPASNVPLFSCPTEHAYETLI